MNQLSYASEKFTTGVHILAEGRGRIRDRLLDAYRSQICSAKPPAWSASSDVPEELRDRIDDLNRRLTSARDAGDGTIAATVDQMTEEEAVDVAREITALAYELRSVLEDGRLDRL